MGERAGQRQRRWEAAWLTLALALAPTARAQPSTQPAPDEQAEPPAQRLAPAAPRPPGDTDAGEATTAKPRVPQPPGLDRAGPPATQPTPESPPDSTDGDAGGDAADALLTSLQASIAEISDLRSRVEASDGEARNLLLRQLEEVRSRHRRALRETAEALQEQAPVPGDSEATEEVASLLVAQLEAEALRTRKELEQNQEALLQTATALKSATDEQADVLREERDAGLVRAGILLGEADAILRARESLGQEVHASRTWLKRYMSDGAKLFDAALHSVAKNLEQAEAQDESPEQQRELQLLEDTRSQLTEVQRKNLELMDSYGLDTTLLRQNLIRTSGEVSGDILDAEVAKGLLQQWKADALDWLREHGSAIAFKSLSFVFILLVFGLLAKASRWVVRRALARSTQISSLANEFVVKSAGRVVLGIGLVIAAAQVGIQVAPLLAGLGIAGFVIGFALQDTLSNFAAGMMILMYRPFDVGDVVEAAGVMGTVKAMNLVTTSVLTFDNQMLIVPNGKIWGDVIRNVTHQTSRRVDLKFGIGYRDDIEHAEKVLESILADNPRVLADPAPNVRLHELGESSVNFVVRPWVKTSEYWDAYWEITREVKRRFDAEGISIPFPQRDVHVYEERLLREVPRDSRASPRPTKPQDTEHDA